MSPAGSLPSGCSPEPQGTPSTVWVLQGDEGKPQHGADVLGKGSQATNHSLTLPGLRVWGEMSHLSPAQCHPDPTSWDTPSPFYPPWRCPPAQAQQPECGLKAGRGFSRVSSCVSRSGFFPFSFWSAQVGAMSSLGVLPNCPLARARLVTGHGEWPLLGSGPGQRVKTRGFQGRPGKSHPAAAPCPRVTLAGGFSAPGNREHLPGQLQAPGCRGMPQRGGDSELCPGAGNPRGPGVWLGRGGNPQDAVLTH